LKLEPRRQAGPRRSAAHARQRRASPCTRHRKRAFGAWARRSRALPPPTATPYQGGTAPLRGARAATPRGSTIDDARFGFYDITGFNPNVMIELGIAFHAGKKVFLFYNEKRHRNSPAVKAGKDLVPSDLQGHERFAYRTPEEFDRELRQALRVTLGIGQNSVHDLKQRISTMLRNNPQPIRKIVEGMNAPEQDVQDALYSLRLEKRVTIEGHGRGAKWRLMAH
jgi:hypothetical protein